MKAATVDALRGLLESSKSLRSAVNAANGTHVSGAKLEKCQELGQSWFDDARPKALALGLHVAVLESYDQLFTRLIAVTGGKTARRSSVESVLCDINAKFKAELVVPAQTHMAGAKASQSDFGPLLDRLPDTFENAYVAEGLACLSDGHLKASVVLGWCACIDRIHRVIEQLGLERFNVATIEMAGKASGRFKRFTKKYSVESVSELRQVFDTDILLVLEYLQLIDVNQQVRLRSCFEMRNHAAHPGDAPVSRFNVLSFYSDVIEIVLANEAFALDDAEHADSIQD